MGLFRYLRPKLLLRLLGTMVVLVVALRIAGPTLVSPDTIRREIEANLSAWTGAELEFSGTPSFSFWPTPQMAFEDVRLRYPGSPAGTGELLTADRIAVDFSVLGSLVGAPDLGDVELFRPLFHVRRDESGALNWRGSERIGLAFARDAGEEATAGTLPQFGTLLVRDGTIAVDDRRRGQQYRISDVAGKIAWPKPSSDLDISLKGVINGEVAELQVTADEPTQLLNGRNADVSLSLRSEPLTLDFDGAANLSSNGFATGRIRVAVSSFSDLLNWSGTRFTPGGTLGAVTLEGNIATSDHTARLDNLALDIQGANATGALDLSLPPKGTPKIAGTLAFDTIDLAAMIGAYAPLPGEDDAAVPAPPAIRIDGLDLDMRLSSREAFLEPLVLTDFAAGIRTSGGQTMLDIGDGSVLGGSVSGQLTASDQRRRPGGELRLSLRDIDLGALIGLAGLSGPLPGGRGSADINLFTEEPLARLDRSGLIGTFRLRFDRGAIADFDRVAFERQARGASIFTMTEVADGSFEFSNATIEGRVDRGIAEISRATFEGAERTLSISGTVPFPNANVALAGSLAARKPDDAAVTEPAINFFIGGLWPDPVVSPMAIMMGVPAN